MKKRKGKNPRLPSARRKISPLQARGKKSLNIPSRLNRRTGENSMLCESGEMEGKRARERKKEIKRIMITWKKEFEKKKRE